MRRIIPCLTLCTMLLALFLSCGDDSTTAPPPENTNVSVESGNAASKSIGVEGGTLTTTANDGTAYTLEIPEGSIPANETITMTPIIGIDGYPLANGVAAGVDLKPAGLVFAVPATLTIETTKTSGAGLVPVAITYEGDASSFAPDFLGSDVGTFTIPLLHFSGGTVGFATAQELEQLVLRGSTFCLQTALDSLATGNIPAAVASYRSCFVSDVLPAINQAGTDRELAKAIGQYTMWKADSRFAIGMPPFDDDSEVQQAMDALVPKLQEAIIRDNGQCQQNESFVSAENVLFWQRQAAHFGLDTVANLLDVDIIVRNLCLRPVVDDVQLPDNMQIGFPHSLDIQFGVIFEGQTASQGAPFSVTIQADGLDVQHPTGFTNAQGQYTTVVTATTTGPIELTATACLVFPGSTTPTPICVTKVIAGEGAPIGFDMTGRWHLGFVSFDVPTVCGQFGGGAVVDIEQHQNAVTGTWTSTGLCGMTTMSGTLSGTLATAAAGGLELDNWSIGITSVSNPGVCLAFIPEIVAIEPGRFTFQNGRVDNTNAIGESTNSGCVTSNTFIMFMDRCNTQNCPPAIAN